MRGAIALNNMGCRMMARGCFLQAAETLQDAVLTMKASCRESILEFPRDSQIQSMIHKAVQRTAQPEKTMMPPGDSVNIHVVADDLDVASVDRALDLLACPGTFCFPVCIESHNQTMPEQDEALLSSIILHNFGLTCVARAYCAKNKSVQTKLFANGQKIFQLCQSVLASRSDVCRDQVQLKRLLFLGIAVLSGIVLCLDGKGDESTKYHSKLAMLKAGVLELERSDVLKAKCRGAAAA